LDIAKNSFHAHGADERGERVFSRRLSRGELLDSFAAQPTRLVAMEATREPSTIRRRTFPPTVFSSILANRMMQQLFRQVLEASGASYPAPPERLSASSAVFNFSGRTTDDRFALPALSRVEGGDGMVKGRDGADIGSQPARWTISLNWVRSAIAFFRTFAPQRVRSMFFPGCSRPSMSRFSLIRSLS